MLGKPEQAVHPARPCTRVGLLGADYPGSRPRFEVEAGQRVRRGQRLFHDKRSPGILATAPAAGTVAAIHRGERRALVSVEIDLDAAEREGGGDQVAVDSFTGAGPASLEAEAVRALLLESGLWTALRTRPYSRVPAPGTSPAALFVTAVDTHPLAPDPEVVLAGREEDFAAGLQALGRPTSGPKHLCTGGASRLEAPPGSGFGIERFEGPHPSGTPGLHIHLLAPVHRNRTVWHVGYQDKSLRLSGAVLGDTINYDSQTLELTFDIAHVPGDNADIEAQGGLAEVLYQAVNDPTRQRLIIHYVGAKPDLLRSEAQAIVTGKLGDDGVFYADEILLKCPTKYEEAVPEQAASN